MLGLNESCQTLLHDYWRCKKIKQERKTERKEKEKMCLQLFTVSNTFFLKPVSC